MKLLESSWLVKKNSRAKGSTLLSTDFEGDKLGKKPPERRIQRKRAVFLLLLRQPQAVNGSGTTMTSSSP